MKKNNRKICFIGLFLSLFIGHLLELNGQEIPKIAHFSKQIYKAENQNWDIAIADDCRMYFANSKGLLEFDGTQWRTFLLPSREIVRSLARTTNGKIFTGGYASFGYWEADEKGKLQYNSLEHLFDPKDIEDTEIWNIIELKDQIIFQSFSKIFIYKESKITTLIPPSNIMFLTNVNGTIWVPTRQDGLFKLTADKNFKFIEGSQILINKKIATIIPSMNDNIIIGTQEGELINFKSGKFKIVENKLSNHLKKYQLNKACRLQNGNLIFGTLLNGLFETDKELNILRIINQKVGLQNNTVLSLFENSQGNLWVGMDKGIDLIEFGGNLSFFNDVNGLLGTVYTALKKNNYLYVGTNHGVFYKERSSQNSTDANNEFRLLENSQGQVWQLKQIDDQIICGHNSGTFVIDKDQLKLESPISGGWYLDVYEKNKFLIQGTYTGLVAFYKENNEWKYLNKIEGFNLPIKKIIVDQNKLVWGIGPHKSLFSFKLSDDLKKVLSIKEWNTTDGLPSLYNMDLTKVQNEFFIKSSDQYFKLDDKSQKIIPLSKVQNDEFPKGNYKIINFEEAGYFKIFANYVEHHFKNKLRILNLNLVPDYENIIQLDSLNFLFCLENGYAILNYPSANTQTTIGKSFKQAKISEVSINDTFSIFPFNLKEVKPITLKPKESQLKIYGTVPCLYENTDLEYRLEGADELWADFAVPYYKEYSFLPAGDYKFMLREKDSKLTDSFSFSILPKWYQTNFFKGLCTLLFALLLFVLYRLHLRRLDRETKKIAKEKNALMKQELIALKNRQLEKEVTLKSEELANSTMNLIKKNEVLLKIKESLKALESNANKNPHQSGYKKLRNTIDDYLTNEEDWKLFESNFTQVHETFLRKLKQEYPSLTPGDLKLAAYLKMNLSSKDIAPLLSISVRSVENKRYRLRVKLKINPKTNLTEFLMRY